MASLVRISETIWYLCCKWFSNDEEEGILPCVQSPITIAAPVARQSTIENRPQNRVRVKRASSQQKTSSSLSEAVTTNVLALASTVVWLAVALPLQNNFFTAAACTQILPPSIHLRKLHISCPPRSVLPWHLAFVKWGIVLKLLSSGDLFWSSCQVGACFEALVKWGSFWSSCQGGLVLNLSSSGGSF